MPYCLAFLNFSINTFSKKYNAMQILVTERKHLMLVANLMIKRESMKKD